MALDPNYFEKQWIELRRLSDSRINDALNEVLHPRFREIRKRIAEFNERKRCLTNVEPDTTGVQQDRSNGGAG